MTIKQQLEKKEMRIGYSMWLAIPICLVLLWLGAPVWLIVFLFFIFLVLFGVAASKYIRCPKCNSDLGFGSFTENKGLFYKEKTIKYCPHCGLDLDQEI